MQTVPGLTNEHPSSTALVCVGSEGVVFLDSLSTPFGSDTEGALQAHPTLVLPQPWPKPLLQGALLPFTGCGHEAY